jgi:hypothetical protein
MILDRTCIKCGTQFQLKPKGNSSNICSPCKAKYAREYARRKIKESPEGYKELYPMNEDQKKRKFMIIQRELAAITDRNEWIEYMKYKLDTLDPKILIWIYDRRDAESRSDSRERRIRINEYEDTRSTKQNDKSWFD